MEKLLVKSQYIVSGLIIKKISGLFLSQCIVQILNDGLTGDEGGQKMLPFKQCPVCGGELASKEVEKLLRGGVNTAVVSVQAEVCLHCGVTVYTNRSAGAFNSLIRPFVDSSLRRNLWLPFIYSRRNICYRP